MKRWSGGDATLGWLLLVVFAFSLVCYDFGIEFAPIWDNTGTKFIYKEKSLGAYFIYLFIYFGGGFINNECRETVSHLWPNQKTDLFSKRALLASSWLILL